MIVTLVVIIPTVMYMAIRNEQHDNRDFATRTFTGKRDMHFM
jgi:hypothetical protein